MALGDIVFSALVPGRVVYNRDTVGPGPGPDPNEGRIQYKHFYTQPIKWTWSDTLPGGPHAYQGWSTLQAKFDVTWVDTTKASMVVYRMPTGGFPGISGWLGFWYTPPATNQWIGRAQIASFPTTIYNTALATVALRPSDHYPIGTVVIPGAPVPGSITINFGPSVW